MKTQHARPPSRDHVRGHPHGPRGANLPVWLDALTVAKRRLTPLFWSHILLYGEVKLHMTRRLALSGPALLGRGEEIS